MNAGNIPSSAVIVTRIDDVQLNLSFSLHRHTIQHKGQFNGGEIHILHACFFK